MHLEHRLDGLNASIQTAQNDAENGQLGKAQTELSSVQANLTSVNSTLYSSKDFTILDDLPIARQNLQSVRSTVGLGLQLVSAGLQIFQAGAPLESANGHLDVSLKDGQIPVAAVQSIQSTLNSVLADLPRDPKPSSSALVLGRVLHQEKMVYSEARQRRAELNSVDQGLTLLNAIAGGDGSHRYLIAVANTAEMRGAGGMILSYGVLDASGGRVTLGNFGPIDDLKLSHPVSAQFPKDFTTRFAAQQPTLLWRNATLMSDFTVDAPVLEAMYTQATGLPVDGVFQVDPAGLGAILAATGPVAVPGLGAVDAANVVPLTLNKAYVQFPNRPVRQEYLTTVAKSAFAALTSGRLPSLRPLGTALVKAAMARHIEMSFKDPSVDEVVQQLGYGGGLPGPGTNFAQVTIQNFGGDKMDYYIQSALTVHHNAGSRQVTAEITLKNTAPPDGLPPYIFGPETDGHDPPGQYEGFVTLYLPPLAYLESSTGQGASSTPTEGTQNQNTAISFAVDLPPGGTADETLTVGLSPRSSPASRFVLVPTPRVNPTKLVVTGS